MFTQIKKDLVKILQNYGYVIDPAVFSYPPNGEMGDLALPCFELARKMKKNPIELATEISSKVVDKKLSKIEAVGPYVNFYFLAGYFNKKILCRRTNYKKVPGQIMIEYSQPNTHKEFHIGHLRNAVLGASLVNLKRFCGREVFSANYIGDSGSHVAKWLWFFYKKYQGVLPVDKSDVFGKIYAEAVEDLSKNEKLAEEVSVIHRLIDQAINKKNNREKLSEEENKIFNDWKQTKDASLHYFQKVYELLNISFDLWFFESEEEFAGKKMLENLLENKKIAEIKNSDGAVIADLREHGLDVLVLIKSDGNLLYGAKDLPLGIKKFNQYKVEESYYIVDKRQSLYLKQVFKLLDLLGYEHKKKVHIDYDFVTLPDGAMSSRKGNVVIFNDFYQEVLNESLKQTEQRHSDWEKEKIEQTASKIALAGIKFFLLKYDNSSVIVFDVKKALSFDGDSGVYLLYVISRINSILKKKKPAKYLLDWKILQDKNERLLLQKIGQFSEVIEKADKTDSLVGVSVYLLELGQLFNSFYHNCPVLSAENKLQKMRLMLCLKTKEVLQQGLGILNIETLQEM